MRDGKWKLVSLKRNKDKWELYNIAQDFSQYNDLAAKNPDKLRDAWKTSGMLAEEGTAFFVSGEDKTGALVASLDAIAKAGVNIVATEAIAVGGKFGVILWVSPDDLDKTAKALGAK